MNRYASLAERTTSFMHQSRACAQVPIHQDAAPRMTGNCTAASLTSGTKSYQYDWLIEWPESLANEI
jgi:hypothetical protein